VVDEEGSIVGIFFEKDGLNTILDSSYHNEVGALVSDLMSTEICNISENSSFMKVAEKILPLVSDDSPLWIGMKN